MKKTLVIIILLTIFTSCNLIYEIEDEIYMGYLDLPLYSGPELDTSYIITKNIHTEVWYHTKNLLVYKYDTDDYWQSPFESISLGTGDCEDYAILFLNILYYNYNIKGNIILVNHQSRSVVAGGRINHCVVELPDGRQIDPQTGLQTNYTVKYRYTFDEVFR